MSINAILPPPLISLVHFRKSAILLSALVLASTSAAPAATIGLNFLRGAGADILNVQNGAANSLLTTDVAGAPAYAQANWNNLGANGTNIILLDSTGASSGVTLDWAASGAWSQSGGGTPGIQGGPDGNLMNSYLDSNGTGNTTFNANLWSNSNNNKPLLYFSGLSAWMAGQGVAYYDVVIYADGDDAGGARTGEYWTVAASGGAATLTLGSDQQTHVWICDRTNFTAALTYAQVPPLVQSGLSARFGNFAGNFTVLDSLNADTFLLRDAEFATRCPINALQIVPRATPIPATIAPLPSPQVFSGATVLLRATVAGRTPQTFQWQKNGSNLSDGGNIAGSSTATLAISNVSGGDVASYTLVVTSPVGSISSAPAALSIAAPAGDSYAEKIVTNVPYAYWRFNEVGDPSTNYTIAVDYAGGFHGTYGSAALNGYSSIGGPTPSDWPGFEAANRGLQCANNMRPTWVTAPPLNLNTNTATFCAWIYPFSAQLGFTALVGARNGADVAAFGFGNNNNLGYTWNSNNAATFNFGPGSPGYSVPLIPLTNAWSFVALAVSPSNAVLYLFNTNGQLSATNSITHSNEGWSGLTFIGCDAQNSAGTPQGRSFNGVLDEVSVFNRTLPPNELLNLYKKGAGLTAILPAIPRQPKPLALFEGRTARFSIVASGDSPLSYQWRKNGSNLSNGGNVSGVATPSLTISNVTIAGSAGDYDVVVNNFAGAATSIVANLSVVVSNSTPSPYEAKLRQFNPVSYWRLNEANGNQLSYDYWGGVIATNENVNLGSTGPTPPDFTGLESSNTGGSYDPLASSDSATTESLCNNRSQFSIVGWFNTAAVQGTRTGLFGQNDVAEFGFHGTDASGQAQLGMWTPNAAAFMSQTNVIPGVWYLIAGVASGTNVNLYLVSTNGGGGFQVLQSSTAGTTTNYGISAFPFRIGGGGILDATGNFFYGQIDEVAVFDRALSVGEMSDLFGAALTGGELPPGIAVQPTSLTLYAGRTATFHVSAVGTSPGYQWRKDGAPISNGANVLGVTTDTLQITGVAGGNVGAYDVVISNRVGMVTSVVATLAVITPTPGSYEAITIGLSPYAYYRLNETNDPSTGTAPAWDFWGGHSGVYANGSQNGFNGILGPQPPYFIGFDSNNTAMQVSAAANSFATAPVGSLSTNTVTFTAWIYPMGPQLSWAGLLVNRNAGVAGGFNYNDQQMLGYTWNNNNANTYNFVTGLVIPSNQWSFVAVAISPTDAILYLINSSGLQSATNSIAHTADVFGNNWQIGRDNLSNNNDGTRNFNGIIDEVALYLQTLTQSQIEQLYNAAGAPLVRLTITPSGSNLILAWPQGTLLEANTVTGPYTTNSATSPYTFTPVSGQKFFKVIVR